MNCDHGCTSGRTSDQRPTPTGFCLYARAHARLLKQGPDIGAAEAADLAGEFRLQIGEPDVIGPTLSTDHDRMRAFAERAPAWVLF